MKVSENEEETKKLFVRGPTFSGLLERPEEENARVCAGGWFHSGIKAK